MARKVSEQIICRPALPLDTHGMSELTSKIWDGEDYIPKVWEEWLFDPHGLLAVAMFSGRIVGIGKLTKLSTNDWWLEGLRVHPQYEDQGIASHIHDYLLGIWEEIGSGKIRFATMSIREPVKYLAQSRHFKIAGEYTIFKASSAKSQISNWINPFTLVKLDEIDKLVAWLSQKSSQQLAFGLFNLGWQFAPPRKEFLRKILFEQQAYWWNHGRGILIMVEKQDGVTSWARARHILCHPGDLVKILLDLRLMGKKLDYAGITWLAPILPNVEKSLREAGYEQDWDSSLLVFEKTGSS